MKEKNSVNVPIGSLIIVGLLAICGVLVWKFFIYSPPKVHAEPFQPPSLPVDESAKRNASIPSVMETKPIPQDHLPPLPGRALPVLKSISDMFRLSTGAKPPFRSSTLCRGEKSRYEIILQPDWIEATNPEFESTFLFSDEIMLGVRSKPVPNGNTPHLIHAGNTLDSVVSGYKDLRLRMQDTMEIAGESWNVYELGSAQSSHLGLFTYAGPKGCFVIAVAAQNRSFELRRNEWSRVIQSFRFPPR